jgi:hypothetical protein
MRETTSQKELLGDEETAKGILLSLHYCPETLA